MEVDGCLQPRGRCGGDDRGIAAIKRESTLSCMGYRTFLIPRVIDLSTSLNPKVTGELVEAGCLRLSPGSLWCLIHVAQTSFSHRTPHLPEADAIPAEPADRAYAIHRTTSPRSSSSPPSLVASARTSDTAPSFAPSSTIPPTISPSRTGTRIRIMNSPSTSSTSAQRREARTGGSSGRNELRAVRCACSSLRDEPELFHCDLIDRIVCLCNSR